MDRLLIHLFIHWLIYRVMSMSYHFLFFWFEHLLLYARGCVTEGKTMSVVQSMPACRRGEETRRGNHDTVVSVFIWRFTVVKEKRDLKWRSSREFGRGRTQGNIEGSGSRIDFAGRRDIGSKSSCKTVGRPTTWEEGKVTHHCQSLDHGGNIQKCDW